MSPKLSNSNCFTKPNLNIFLCRQAKRARKFQIVVVLPSQILIYLCVGKLENSSSFIKSNPNVLFIDEQNEPKNYKKYCITNCQMQAQKCQLILVCQVKT